MHHPPPTNPPSPLQPNKRHPRDWATLGRARVELKTPTGALVVPSIASKDALLKAIAKIIPGLPGRHQRLMMMQAQQAEMARRAAAAAAGAAKPAAAAAGGGGGKGKGGGGRKGRR